MTESEREGFIERLRYQLDSRTFNTQLHEDLIDALVRQSAPQGEPVTIKAIVSCLEGSSGNTDTSPKWRAATELRRIDGWETATLPVASPPAQPDADVVRDALRRCNSVACQALVAEAGSVDGRQPSQKFHATPPAVGRSER